MARNGKIILSKDIKIDREYKNVLNYTETQMVDLCQNVAHLVASANDYSFIRIDQNVIEVQIPYGTCLKANYIAMQNPNYSGKWFFAFIDKLEFRSPTATRITFSIDEFTTWFDYWSPKTCFVLREHVANDTIGLHTVPENLETGEYIINEEKNYYKFQTYYIMVNTSVKNNSQPGYFDTNLGNSYIAGNIYVCRDNTGLYNLMQSFSGIDNAINNVWLVPRFLVSLGTQTFNEDGYLLWDGQSIASFELEPELHMDKPTSLLDYTPKNNKLLTYPFCYLIFSNNNGSSNILKYEYFEDDECGFVFNGIPTIGTSIMGYPFNYKGSTGINESECLSMGKYPTLSWSQDAYTNWLTQNAINLHMGTIGGVVQVLGGMTTMGYTALSTTQSQIGGTGTFAQGFNTLTDIINQKYQHSLIPQTTTGNTNSGDILTASNQNGVLLQAMSIKPEFAKICDDYLTRMGYQVNTLKIPAQTSRPHWNYVKIGPEECIGYSNNAKQESVPATAMENINNAYRRGLTIWHHHSELGDYSLDNRLQ